MDNEETFYDVINDKRDYELWRQVKLLIVISSSILLGGFCFENEGIIGKALFLVMSVIFGEVRFVIPPIIILYAVLHFIFRSRHRMGALLFVLSALCMNICLIVVVVNIDGGILGNVIYFILSHSFGDTFIAVFGPILLLALIWILVRFILVYISPVSEASYLSESSNFNDNDMKLSGMFYDKVRAKVGGKRFLLKQILKEFGIEAEVKKIKGSSIDRYILLLEHGTRVSKVKQLEEDIRLGLGVNNLSIDIQDGKIFIDIPKKNVKIISFTDVIKRDDFKRSGKLVIPIGQTVNGEVRYGDISEMPHLLIAGATGSGKSVFLNSSICSLLEKNTPQDLRFIMVDTKHTELPIYKYIPHLFGNVLENRADVEKALEWLILDMDKRYEIMAHIECRDIVEYNQNTNGIKMPYLVIIVDEYAGLMPNKKIEGMLEKLLAKSRASGIHFIIATQRPEVRVLKGLMQANIPGRIAFAVVKGKDSELILDKRGAEKLRGSGDMIYHSSNGDERLQGYLIDTDTVRSLIKKFKPKSMYQEPIKTIADNKLPLIYNRNNNSNVKSNLTKKLDIIDCQVIEDSNHEITFKDHETEKIINLAIGEKTISKAWIARMLKPCSNQRAEQIFNEIAMLEKEFNIPIIGERKSTTRPFEFLLTREQFERIKKLPVK